MNMLAYGLISMDEVMPADAIPPIEDIIEGIADLMERALTPDDGGNTEIGKTIVRQIFEASRQRFEQMRNPEQE
jgi:TetR/AcrR family acrAB operon transcriptional repressor